MRISRVNLIAARTHVAGCFRSVTVFGEWSVAWRDRRSNHTRPSLYYELWRCAQANLPTAGDPDRIVAKRTGSALVKRTSTRIDLYLSKKKLKATKHMVPNQLLIRFIVRLN